MLYPEKAVYPSSFPVSTAANNYDAAGVAAEYYYPPSMRMMGIKTDITISSAQQR